MDCSDFKVPGAQGRRTSIAVACLALLLRSLAAHGAESPMRQIVENTHRTQASVAVRQEYIEPLQLDGKNFHSALGTLLEQGFSCAAKDGMAEIVRPDRRLPASLECRREGTKVDKRCDLMILGVSAADSQISTASQLVRNLSEAKVGHVAVFCAGKPDVTAKVRATFDQNRLAAEKKLAERMKALDASGKTGAEAFLQCSNAVTLVASSHPTGVASACNRKDSCAPCDRWMRSIAFGSGHSSNCSRAQQRARAAPSWTV